MAFSLASTPVPTGARPMPRLRMAALALGTLALAGCQTPFGGTQPQPLNPAPRTAVDSSALPPPATLLGDPSAQTATEQGVETAALDPSTGANLPAPGPAITVTQDTLVGAWRLSSEGLTCQLNMSQTTWTGGFRASTRGCASPDLQGISAWSLDGSQVTLLSEGTPVASFAASAPARFDGLRTNGARASFFR